jgi:hypothetical protein
MAESRRRFLKLLGGGAAAATALAIAENADAFFRRRCSPPTVRSYRDLSIRSIEVDYLQIDFPHYYGFQGSEINPLDIFGTGPTVNGHRGMFFMWGITTSDKKPTNVSFVDLDGQALDPRPNVVVTNIANTNSWTVHVTGMQLNTKFRFYFTLVDSSHNTSTVVVPIVCNNLAGP